MVKSAAVARPAAPPLPLQTKFPAHRIAKVGDLVPYAENARTHSAEQIAKIVRSIEKFGFTNPILIDGNNGILAGHGRLRAALFLGMDSVPVIDLSHLTDTERRAYVLADNRLALEAGWDNNLLTTELGRLDLEGFDLSFTGFDPLEIEGLSAEEIDNATEWQGMPEFEQPDDGAFQRISIHFKDAAAVQTFARLIGQKITDQTKSTWFPFVPHEPRRLQGYDGDS